MNGSFFNHKSEKNVKTIENQPCLTNDIRLVGSECVKQCMHLEPQDSFVLVNFLSANL